MGRPSGMEEKGMDRVPEKDGTSAVGAGVTAKGHGSNSNEGILGRLLPQR